MDTIARNIEASAHRGTWTRTGIPAGQRANSYAAGELASMNTSEFVIWESAGHVHGRELFCRSRFVPQANGSLAGYDSDGRLVIVHPAGRSLRILTR